MLLNASNDSKPTTRTRQVPKRPNEDLRLRILRTVRDIQDITGGRIGLDMKQLAAVLEQPYTTTCWNVNALTEAGLVTTVDDRRWLHLTAAGRVVAARGKFDPAE